MGIAESLKKARIIDKEIDGQPVRFRRINTGELLDLSEEKDKKLGMRRLVALSVVDEEDKPVFASADEVLAADWLTIKALTELAVEVNGLKLKDAEKNSTTPPSSP